MGDEIRILLLGPTGSGKSSFGNTILGKTSFDVGLSGSGVTKILEECKTIRFRREISVIDTPGYSTEKRHMFLTTLYSHSQRNAICLILSVSRLTKDINRLIREFEICVPDFRKRTFIIFTGNDILQGNKMTLKDFIDEFPETFSKIKSRYKNRIRSIDNTLPIEENEEHIKELIAYIDRINKPSLCCM